MDALLISKTFEVRDYMVDDEIDAVLQNTLDQIEDLLAAAVNAMREKWPELIFLIDGQE